MCVSHAACVPVPFRFTLVVDQHGARGTHGAAYGTDTRPYVQMSTASESRIQITVIHFQMLRGSGSRQS